MQRNHAQIYSEHFLLELKDLTSFKDEAASSELERLQEICEQTVTRTAGGQTALLKRFAKLCAELFEIGEKGEESICLKKQNKYIIALTAFTRTYPHFTTNEWKEEDIIQWRNASTILLSPSSLKAVR